MGAKEDNKLRDFHDAADVNKFERWDASLINFMNNHKVSVQCIVSPSNYIESKWVAKTEYYTGEGNTIRSAIANLEKSIYGDNAYDR